jgi:hypothetical protein
LRSDNRFIDQSWQSAQAVHKCTEIAIAEELGLGCYRMVRQRSTVYPQENRSFRIPVSGNSDRREKNMPLLNVLIALIVVGFLLWLVNRFVPMAGSIKSILNGVVVFGVVLRLLNVFGIFHSLSRVRIG